VGAPTRRARLDERRGHRLGGIGEAVHHVTRPTRTAATEAPRRAAAADGEPKARVLVIGGGPNGLVCAIHLAEAGCDVAVLEQAGTAAAA
jgi:NADPH-dependent 2,4-dienoyl-CoA reductase/sulfur reductase-like enzyme